MLTRLGSTRRARSVFSQAGCCAFLAVWMVYAAYTASMGEVTTKEVSSGTGLDVSYKVSRPNEERSQTVSARRNAMERRSSVIVPASCNLTLFLVDTASIERVMVCFDRFGDVRRGEARSLDWSCRVGGVFISP